MPKVWIRGHIGFMLDKRIFAVSHICLSSSTAPSVTRKIKGNELQVSDNISMALLNAREMLVPSPTTRLTLIHFTALSIVSFVASLRVGEKRKVCLLNAIMLNESSGLSSERAAHNALLVSSSGFPCMLPLISTT
uniref:Uncharacterized protein n=1 Tax=Opuntia streptacantha TaxID=393608 RepID=A0A7C9A5V4_OPUST